MFGKRAVRPQNSLIGGRVCIEKDWEALTLDGRAKGGLVWDVTDGGATVTGP